MRRRSRFVVILFCALLLSRELVASCELLSVRCLCASQDRLRRTIRTSPSSWALSTPTLRDAHGDVRLVRVGQRSQERGRTVRAISLPC